MNGLHKEVPRFLVKCGIVKIIQRLEVESARQPYPRSAVASLAAEEALFFSSEPERWLLTGDHYATPTYFSKSPANLIAGPTSCAVMEHGICNLGCTKGLRTFWFILIVG